MAAQAAIETAADYCSAGRLFFRGHMAKAKRTGRKAAKRVLIDTGRDKRFVRRAKGGKFKESDDVGRSLASDRRRKAKRATKPGQGDKGDRPRRKGRTK